MQRGTSAAHNQGFVQELIDRLRGMLSPPEALALIGRIAIWAHFTQPRRAPGPQAVELFSSKELAPMFERDVFQKLKSGSARGQNTQLVFDEGIAVRYEQLDAQVVGNLTY